MMKTTTRTLAIVATLSATLLAQLQQHQSCCEAFAPPATRAHPRVGASSSCTSSLCLLPTQASELVEHAYPSSTEEDEDDVDSPHRRHQQQQQQDEEQNEVISSDGSQHHQATHQQQAHHSSPLSFVTRVFQFPSTFIKVVHPSNKEDGSEDVVLFPVTGYRLVQDEANHRYRALPTQTNPSCRILPRTVRDEVPYGRWYHPSTSSTMSPSSS